MGLGALARLAEVRVRTPVPGHPDVQPDATSLLVKNSTWSQELHANGTTLAGFDVDTTSLQGEYEVRVRTTLGRVSNETQFNVTVAKPVNDVVTLDRLDTLSTLPSSSAGQRYRLVHNGACDQTSFRVSVTSPAGFDVDLYVADADHGTDGTAYAQKAEGSGSSESVQWTGAAPGEDYYVLVKTKNTSGPTPYSLRWGTPTCGGSGGGYSEPPVRQLGDLETIQAGP